MTEVEETALPFVAPEDWQTALVGEEFFIILGKMLDAEKNVGTPKPYLGNKSVQWGRIDTEDLSMIKLTPGDLRRYRLVDGDLLVCEGGDIGRSAIWRGQMDECYFQKALHRVRPRGGYSPVLLRYLLEYYSKTGFLLNFATQTSIAHLPKDKFEVLPLPKPSMEEQEAIADALSDADALIEGLERLIAKKRLIKQGAMQDLLTAKRRLPGFSEEWVERTLGALLTVRHGRSQKEVEVPSGQYPILATGGQIGTADSYLWDKPSVLIGRKGTIDRPQFVETPFWTVDTLFYTDIHTTNDARFIFYVFQRIDWQSYNEASGVPSLNAKTIENIDVCVPGPEEQIAISAVLKDMDAEIEALETRLEKARAIKEGMMQNLLTGRIRLI